MNGAGSDPRRLGGGPAGRGPETAGPANPRIIWSAFVAAIFIYMIVAYLVTKGEQLPGTLPPWVLPAVAGVFAVEALFVIPILRRRAAATAGPLTTYIMQWAADEAVAVVGFMSVFMGGPPRAMLYYSLVSIALLVLHRPQEES